MNVVSTRRPPERVPERVPEAPRLDQWRREGHLAADDTLTRFPARRGHRLTLLRDGPETYDAMFAAFDVAEKYIHVMSYMFNHGDVGQRFAAALVRARERGVTVRVLYDWLGSVDCSKEYFDSLRKAQILARPVRPLHRTMTRGFAALNRRNHRKVAVIDGDVGFVGGVNVTESYRRISRVLHRRKQRLEPQFAEDGWRDTHVELHGPAVTDLDTVFLEDWYECSGDDAIPPAGSGARSHWNAPPCRLPDSTRGALLRVASTNGSGQLANEPFDLYAEALRRARACVKITHSYFAPPRWFIQEVCTAARRGVDVRILLPARSDNPLAFYASRSNYTRLLRAGARLYEMQACFLHSKTMVVDGWWSIIGSANLDMRSWLHNDETCVVAYDEPFARRMETQFELDLAACQELSLRRWRRRPFRQRIKERATKPIYHWL